MGALCRVEGPLRPLGGTRVSGPDRRRVTRSGQTYRLTETGLEGRSRESQAGPGGCVGRLWSPFAGM